jgi:hypothetical protein
VLLSAVTSLLVRVTVLSALGLLGAGAVAPPAEGGRLNGTDG